MRCAACAHKENLLFALCVGSAGATWPVFPPEISLGIHVPV